MTIGRAIIVLLALLAANESAQAQQTAFDELYFPLNQAMPTGVAGHWRSTYAPPSPGYFQPLRVELPTQGVVTFFNGSPAPVASQPSPTQIGVAVGHTYRLRISHMPEFPGVELYPTVEVLDRLHPPPGKANEFPVPVEFTFDEVQFALQGRLVTKVVYLEQPQLASRDEQQTPLTVLTIPMHRNLLAEADRLGRPLAIIRLGGRLPDIHGNDRSFFGRSAPLLASVSKPPAATETTIGEPAAAGRPAGNQEAIIFTPAEPRVSPPGHVGRTFLSASSCPPSGFGRQECLPHGHGPPAFAAGPAAPHVPLAKHPDEYLFDGGDRDLPVHYDNFNRLGLDTEDAVAEYVDHLGRRHMRPTNRVAVYAPRFGAVRSVSQSEEGLSVERLASAQDMAHGHGLRSRVASIDHAQRDRLGGVRVRSRVSGLEIEAQQGGVAQITRASSHTRLLRLYQDLAFIRTGRFRQSDEARLAYGIQAAVNWQSVTPPFIIAQTDSAQEVYASFRPQEFVGREDERKTPGHLRIVKLADKQTAKPGDVVTFTIRYDNVGDRELYHIRIVDNLTPRLVYVEDSAESDRAGRLVVEDNEEGSLVLRFEVDDPLPGHEGGVVSFQARVR